jgi:hypothetical protein
MPRVQIDAVDAEVAQLAFDQLARLLGGLGPALRHQVVALAWHAQLGAEHLAVGLLARAVAVRGLDVVDAGIERELHAAAALLDGLGSQLAARRRPAVHVAHAAERDHAQLATGLTKAAILHGRTPQSITKPSEKRASM